VLWSSGNSLAELIGTLASYARTFLSVTLRHLSLTGHTRCVFYAVFLSANCTSSLYRQVYHFYLQPVNNLITAYFATILVTFRARWGSKDILWNLALAENFAYQYKFLFKLKL